MITELELEEKAICVAIRTFFYDSVGKEREIYNWLENINETGGDEGYTRINNCPFRIKASLYHLDFCDFWFTINYIIKQVEINFGEQV